MANLCDAFLQGQISKCGCPFRRNPEVKPLWCGLESVVPQWLPEWSSLDLCFAIGILEVELGFPRKDYDLFSKYVYI